MIMATKKDIFITFIEIFEIMDKEEIIKSLFDYYSTDELVKLLEHFKSEL